MTSHGISTPGSDYVHEKSRVSALLVLLFTQFDFVHEKNWVFGAAVSRYDYVHEKSRVLVLFVLLFTQ